MSKEQLQQHIDRRHKKPENPTAPHEKGTPLPVKAKVEEEKIGKEQQKIISEIVGKKKRPQNYKPRPATSYVPEKKVKNSGFKYLK